MTATLDKQQTIELPHSKDLEMNVLGHMMTNSDALSYGCDSLNEEDFYYNEHRLIFKKLNEMASQGEGADLLILHEKLKKDQQFISTGGLDYLINLGNHSVFYHRPDFKAHCETIAKYSLARSTFHTLTKQAEKCVNSPQDIEDTLKENEQVLNTLKSKSSSISSSYQKFIQPYSEKDMVKEIKSRADDISTGYFAGTTEIFIPAGALSVVAAPTGHGKTAFQINTCLNILQNNPEKIVYFFSLEESRASIATLFLNTYIGKDISKNNRRSIEGFYKKGSKEFIREESRNTFEEKKGEFFSGLIDNGRLNIHYEDMRAEQFVNTIRFLKNHDTEKRIALICIDYMQLLNLANPRSFSRQEELKSICMMLKDCAVTTGFPILLGAQFNRTVQSKDDTHLTRIGEAGDIERVTNTGIGLFKDGTNLHVKIMKGRKDGDGHAGRLQFEGNSGKITSWIEYKNSPLG